MLKDHAARGVLKSGAAVLLAGAALVAPFVVMELVNRRAFGEAFPFVLFTFMSLHALLIALLLAPAIRLLRATRSLRALGPVQWAGLALWVILAFAYANVVIDQLPCFLGVPVCD